MFASIRQTSAEKEMDQHYPHHCQHLHLQRLLPPEWEESLPAGIWDVGVRNWYGLKLFILCSKWNHNRYFPMSLIKWKKFICSWEMSRSVTEPFCWGLRKLDFNPGSGSVPLCELESQLSFETEVSAGNFWDLWMKNAASVVPYETNFGYVLRSEMLHRMLALSKCWSFSCAQCFFSL